MDVRIVSKADLRETVADWLLLKTGNLDERQELANYCKVALMTDAMSDPDEIRPDPDSDDRRGWWADMDAGPIWRGWRIGTKNWLLTRAKISGRRDCCARVRTWRSSVASFECRRLINSADPIFDVSQM